MFNNKFQNQSGQTLIETIVAIFILVTALTAGLGLTIYILANSGQSINEIVATNLAREGVEVVRMMRDSNWLAGDASLASCADIGDTQCYTTWLTGPTYDLSTPGDYWLAFDPVAKTWRLNNSRSYYLYLQPDGSYQNSGSGTSVYARTIRISNNTSAPYTVANPEVMVQSVVAWRGKNCKDFGSSDDLFLLDTSCKVVTQENLTNWKDYK